MINSKLISVVTLFRHSERTPLMHFDKEFNSAFFEGVSTKKGIEETHAFAKEYYSRYSDHFKPKNTTFLSSSEQRCIESLLATLQSLSNKDVNASKALLSSENYLVEADKYLEEFKTEFKEISIFERDKDFTIRLHANHTVRPTYLSLMKKNNALIQLKDSFINNFPDKEILAEVLNKNLKDQNSPAHILHNDILLLLYISDFINNFRGDLYSVQDKKYNTMIDYFKENNYYNSYVHDLFHQEKVHELFIYKIFNRIVEYFENSIKSNSSETMLLFGHDLNIISSLIFLGIGREKVDIIPFNSKLTYELRQNLEGEYYILIYFQDRLMLDLDFQSFKEKVYSINPKIIEEFNK